MSNVNKIRKSSQKSQNAYTLPKSKLNKMKFKYYYILSYLSVIILTINSIFMYWS